MSDNVDRNSKVSKTHRRIAESEAEQVEGQTDPPKPDILKESGLTYADYASLDDGNRYELVEGHLELMSPAPLVSHQIVSFEMQIKIKHGCESEYMIFNAPIDVILADTEVRQPDLVLVYRKRMHIVKKRGIVGAPDLVVEILSPSTLKRDKLDKRNTYARYGIREYWIVDPENGFLEQFMLRDGAREGAYELVDVFQGNERVSSPNVPCLSFTMAEVMDKVPHLEDE